MNAKNCKQCGQLKPIEQFRKYYGGRKGHYNTCKVCEKINSRYKYLRAKGESMDYDEERELGKIEKLYEVQRAAGWQPPTKAERNKPLVDDLDAMIARYQAPVPTGPVPEVEKVQLPEFIPAALQLMLKCELTEEPDYYLDEVYEELKAEFRPQTHIDQATLQPVYDDTYKVVLEQILDRFYKYEEEYWDK